jgi:hypothetical protein
VRIETAKAQLRELGIVERTVRKASDGSFQATVIREDLEGGIHFDTGLASDIRSALEALNSLKTNALTQRFVALRERVKANGVIRTENNMFGHNFGLGERLREDLVAHRENTSMGVYDQMINVYVPREDLSR